MTESSRAGVVEVSTLSGSGSGWIYRVDSNGRAWILTNERVVEGYEEVTVRLDRSDETKTGTVKGTDWQSDLAVVTMCCDVTWVALPTAASGELQTGSTVVVLGYPGGSLGPDISATTGIVSSYGFEQTQNAWLVQTDAAVNPGKSGGPMLDAQGRVIGVVAFNRDPLFSENIGFAISMQTVNEKLQILEAGGSPRPTPTPQPNRTPTPGDDKGITGTLSYRPSDRSFGCASDPNHATVISDNTIDSAAFLRFEVPDTPNWSLGFVYHDPEGSSNTQTATFIYGDRRGQAYVRHWVRSRGVYEHGPITTRIPTGVLKQRAGQVNELAFRTSSGGTYLRLNDVVVINVPAAELHRLRGWSTVCVGLNADETQRYSIKYTNLRTRFFREGVSGSLTHRDDQFCPSRLSNPAFLASNATNVWAILDFVVPDVDEWTLGFVYHDDAASSSNTYVQRLIDRNYATHRLIAEFWPEFAAIESNFPRLVPGEVYTIEFETSDGGTTLRLDGDPVLVVAGSELIRRRGSASLCVGFSWFDDPYTLRYSNLWAWTQ